MIRPLAVLVFAVSVSAAEPTLESLSASSNLVMPAPIKFQARETIPVHFSNPRGYVVARQHNGTIKGTLGDQPVDLFINRRGGHITGALGLQNVQIDYQDDGNKLAGAAFGQPLDAAFTTVDGGFTVEGHVRLQGFRYTVSDAQHRASGSLGGRDFEITYDLEAGTARGSLAGQGFELDVDRISGRTTGKIGGRGVALTLQNCDLGWVLLHLFLFVP